MNTKVLTIFTEKFKSHRPCFTFKASKTDFHHLPGIYREQLVWLFVIQLFCLLWRKMGNHFAHNLHKFGFAYSEELEVNQWITLDILSSQSECVENTIHCFSTKSIYVLLQVRSNHERLVTFEGDSSSKEKQKDSPLKLKSTAGWKQRGKKEATCSVFNWVSGYAEFT